MIRLIAVVLEGDGVATAVAGALQGRLAANLRDQVRIVDAPGQLCGSAFWETRWREARAWWEATIDADPTATMVLIDYGSGLADEIVGTASQWVVRCGSEGEAQTFRGMDNVRALVARDPWTLVRQLVDALGRGEEPMFRPAWGPFARGRAVASGLRESHSGAGGLAAGDGPGGRTLEGPPLGAPIGPLRTPVTDLPASSGPPDAGPPSMSSADKIDDPGQPSERGGEDVLPVGAPMRQTPAWLTGGWRGGDVEGAAKREAPADWASDHVAELDGRPAAAPDDDPDAGVVMPPLAALASGRPIPAGDTDPSSEVRVGDAPPGRRSAQRRWAPQLRPWGARREAGRRPVVEVRSSRDESRAGSVGQRLMRAHSTIVLSCSPKGGVAKTYDIIGVSELAAEAVEPFGLPAVLLDMNLVNADLREALGLSDDAPAVRGLVDALSHGKEPPAGATPVGSNLQVYVGSRESDGYSLAQIDRLASVARARWALTAVDLANCLPDATGSDAAAVFSYWLRYADVLMIPADPTPAAFAGLLSLLDCVREQVDAGVLQSMPGVIVPILVHPGGEALRDSRIAEMLDRLSANGLHVVTVPLSEDVQLAAWPWRDASIVTADARVRDAYWETLHAMVDAREERE